MYELSSRHRKIRALALQPAAPVLPISTMTTPEEAQVRAREQAAAGMPPGKVAGAPYEEILKDYPDLQRDDVLAAIEYAAHQTDHVVLQGT